MVGCRVTCAEIVLMSTGSRTMSWPWCYGHLGATEAARGTWREHIHQQTQQFTLQPDVPVRRARAARSSSPCDASLATEAGLRAARSVGLRYRPELPEAPPLVRDCVARARPRRAPLVLGLAPLRCEVP